MLKRLQNRAREDAGFTLIELMVVVLIIGILVAIALPTFLGARTRSQNRAAQSDLRNALVAAKTMYTDNNSYAGADHTATGLSSVEGSLQYSAGSAASASTTTPPFQVSVAVQTAAVAGVPANQAWAAARMSASGTCFSIKDVAVTGGTGNGNTPGTWYGSPTTCSGDAALTGSSLNAFP